MAAIARAAAFVAGCRPPRQAPSSSSSPAAARRQLVVVAAKKGGGGKKGSGQKKGPGSLMNPPKPAEPWLQTQVIMDNLLLIESHFRKTGRPIFGDTEVEIEDLTKTLWDAPFAVLMHEVEEGQPNRFCYGNQQALDLFECTWEELIGTESTQSAEDAADVQEDRAAALARAKEQGFIDDYTGWRKSFKGTRFQIGRTTLFNVEAPSGELVGQAVTIREWTYEDGTKLVCAAATIREWTYEDGTKGGEGVDAAAAAAAAAGPPSPEQLAAAEAAVADQGALIRQMKEEQGLSNSSPEVAAEVEKLLGLKQQLQALQDAAAAAEAAS
ncbi:MEKHLA domain-containing isoform B [Chlorella sorokiniana]|uniref:MEKHLA domain-containing isoform B n=1 Tax=Chlorella sorokiniana TaxID=3076 RepID=A0A2P6TCF1_CHLSO|nr:MEKHLA domain-containing isoform B [Chlorella sorokiniana]|eukprot:PRW20317.1 MEKHLA domain-containing isoform B [Chlorella sorokiniana]